MHTRELQIWGVHSESSVPEKSAPAYRKFELSPSWCSIPCKISRVVLFPQNVRSTNLPKSTADALADEAELAMNVTCGAISRKAQRADNGVCRLVAAPFERWHQKSHTYVDFLTGRELHLFLQKENACLEISWGKSDHLSTPLEKVWAFYVQASIFTTRFTAQD